MNAASSPAKAPASTLVLAVALVALSSLLALGVFRPLWPPVVRSSWTALLAIAAGAASLALGVRARFAVDRYQAALLAFFPLALGILYVQPQRVASDGIFYFAPLRSLVVDRDLDFENEYRVLGAGASSFEPTATGRLPNNFSIGPAILWSPFYLLVHLLSTTGWFRPTGFGYPYFTAVATATAVYGFLGVIWCYRLAAGYFDKPLAFGAALLVWWGTFHLWYMAFEPSMSHAPAMAAVAGFLLLTHRGCAGPRGYALAGLAGGVVLLMRWQNAVYLPVALLVGWNRRKLGWRELLAFSAGTALAFLPQALFWKWNHGSFLLVPQGTGYMRWSSPHFLEVLFSSRHGLLSWAPLFWVGLGGWARWARREPALGLALSAAVAASAYVNAAVSDWWAGAAFGARRFDGALPALGLGLASAWEWGAAWVKRHPRWAVAMLVGPLVGWNLVLVALFSGRYLPGDGPLSFRQAASEGLELVYRRTGYPFAWPAALWERARAGVPLPAFDLAGARHASNNVDIRMGDNDALHVVSGWSLPRRGRERTFREAAPRGGVIYVALREAVTYRLEIQFRGTGGAGVRVNGHHAGALGPATEWTATRLELPSMWLAAGLNHLVFLPEEGGRLEVSRVVLTRPGDP